MPVTFSSAALVVVPMATFPSLSIIKNELVDDPMERMRWPPEGAYREKYAEWVEVPIPTNPWLSTVNIFAVDDPT